MDEALDQKSKYYENPPLTYRNPFSQAERSHIVVARIALEFCDRNCPHCGVDATTSLRNPSFGDLERWFEKLVFPKLVILTFGEPFLYWDDSTGKPKTVADIIRLIHEKRTDAIIRLVTSGLDLTDERQCRTTQDISGLPGRIKLNLEYAITISDLPHFNGVTAFEAQMDALLHGFINGIDVFFDSFKQQATALRRFLDELLRRRIIYERDIPRLMRLSHNSFKKVGRALINGIGIEPSFGIDEKCASYGNIGLTLFPDGMLNVPCCSWISPFVGMTSIEKSPNEVNDDIIEFRGALMADDPRFSGIPLEEICIKCAMIARERGTLRDEERFRRCIPNARKVLDAPIQGRRARHLTQVV